MRNFFEHKAYIGFIIILGLGCLLVARSFKKSPSQDSLNSCHNLSQGSLAECVDKINNLEKRDPKAAAKVLNEIWYSAKLGKTQVDLRAFSPYAHDIGMRLINQGAQLSTAINDCGYTFKGACVHGVVMEFVDKEYPKVLSQPKFIGLCDSLKPQINNSQYENCVHGIGHEIRAKIQGDNNKLVLLCNYFSTNYQSSCASGVFMEASKGNNGLGYHIDAPVGGVTFDCSKIEIGYKSTCYASVGSYIEYEATSQPWDASFKLCSTFPLTYQNNCFAGLDERLLMSKGGNKQEAETFCNSLKNKEKHGCLMVREMDLSTLE